MLPDAVPAGAGALLVFSFSREAAESVANWLSACRSREQAGPQAVACFDVRMVQGIPGLVRGLVVKRMRKESPPELLSSTLLVYRDNDGWKRRLGVEDARSAHVLAVAADGRTAGLFAGGFSEEGLRALLGSLRVGAGPASSE